MKPGEKELLITHLFDASPEIVFRAWTDHDQLKHWFAPDGCTIEFKSINVTLGGRFHSCVHDPVHGDCWVMGTYLEITPPKKLVFTMALCDENGRMTNAIEAGKTPDWPEEVVTTITFEPVGTQTKITVHETVSEEEAKKTGAYQSWIKMFNKLNKMLIS